MNRIPFVALVAIALGALALSCSDQSSTPTTPLDLDQPAFHHAPDHAKGGGGNDGGGGGGGGGGDDDGGSSPTVALAGAMATDAAQPVKGRENKRSISYSTDLNAGGRGTITMSFTNAAARAAAENTDCWTDPVGVDRTELEAQLTATAADAALELNFDKTADGDPSDNHGFTAQYGDFRIGLPPHRVPTGTLVSDDGTTAVMEFTGGVVRVWRISDGAKLFCPNDGGDVVTATLTR